jgi:hypothetical protein
MTTHAVNDDPIARREKRSRSLPWLPVLLLTLAIPAGNAEAVCAGSTPIVHGLTSSFEQCGQSAAAFAWFHGRAVQRTFGAPTSNITGNTVSGHDSGRNQTIGDSMMIDGPNGAASGSYFGSTDFGNFGFDGCILNIPENSLGCVGGQDYGVLDYVIGGVDPSSPDVARMAVVSVDFNEFFQAYILDNAGAPAVDGDPCGSDAFSFNPSPVTCAPIPPPAIVATAPVDFGIDVTLGIGDVSGIPMLDDCAIAETRATNCPRNLYAGRVLVYKRGTCAAGEVATFDRRTYLYPPAYPFVPTMVDANWRMFSPEDQDYDEVLDPGEDGSNGGTVNGQLDRVILPGTSPLNTVVRVSRIDDGFECLYFGLAIGLDANALSINPPTNTIFGEMVLSPVVSVNPNAISLAPAPPESDLITSLSATRSGGRVTVQWSTTNERMTQGFDVIGSKKSGKEFRLNSSLIPAQEGTTGQGANYTMTFDADLLKGGSQISVDLVLLDSSRKRFGPVAIVMQRQITGG